MKLTQICASIAILSALTFSLVGCGGGAGSGSRNGLVDAAGVLTYNGEPVADAVIEMRPVDETVKNCMASARTDAKGEFTLMTDRPGDGAVPGKYKTVVKKQTQTIDGMTREEFEKENGPDAQFDKSKLVTENALPVQYSDPINTPLEIEIPAGGNKKIEIKIED